MGPRLAIGLRFMAAALSVVALPALADGDSARNKGEAWLIKHQRGDGSWANADGDLDVQATAAALLALKNGGLARSPTFGAAAAWLANADADSVDSIARKIEALAAADMPGTAQYEADRLYGMREVSYSATWGGYGGGGIDFLDTAMGLTALRVGDATYGSKAAATGINVVKEAICELAVSRISLAPGKRAWPAAKAAANQSAGLGRPSVMATALVLNELRGIAKVVGVDYSTLICGGYMYSILTMQGEAQAWLLDQQNADGGFGEQRTDGTKGTSNVLVTALVYRALNGQTTPPQPQTGNTQAWLLAQQDSTSGSWHNDPLSTAQVVSVLPAASGTQLTDTSRDGISDVVAVQLGNNPALADARNQLGAPTLATPGVTSISFAVGATAGQPFAYSLSGGGPYAVISGSLPPGLTLNSATGQIDGTPTQAGSYSFDYLTTAGFGIGRIDVASAVLASGNGDVPLPGWALVMLGAALLGSGLRKRGTFPATS